MKSASAGTGRTQIITDRVLRLLLGNAALNHMLCLAFTNAAAGEMKKRIMSHLRAKTLNSEGLT